MSQAGINNTTSGPVPPSVPTSFVTDDGTVIPSLNVVNINGGSTSDDNSNGIIVIANPDLSNNEVIQLTNRINGSITTTDATPTTIITFALPTTGVYAFDINVASYNTTDNLGAAYALFTGVRSSGGAATKLNLEDKIVNEEAGNTGCSAQVNVSGNSVLIQAVGIAGKTCNWLAVGTYVFVGA